MRRIAVVISLMLFSSTGWATSIGVGQMGVFQNQGFSTVILTQGGNPLIGPTFANDQAFQPPGTPGLAFLGFGFGIPITTTPTVYSWSFTLTLAGVGTFSSSQQSTLWCDVGSACVAIVGGDFRLPLNLYHPVPGTISFASSLGTSSGPYNFRYVSPVPEPGTLVLLGSGLALLGVARRRYRT